MKRGDDDKDVCAPLETLWPIKRYVDIKFSVPRTLVRTTLLEYLASVYSTATGQQDEEDIQQIQTGIHIPVFEERHDTGHNSLYNEQKHEERNTLVVSKCISTRRFVIWTPSVVACRVVPWVLLTSTLREAVRYESTHPLFMQLRFPESAVQQIGHGKQSMQRAVQGVEWITVTLTVGVYRCLGSMHPVKLQSLAELAVNSCDNAALECLTEIIRYSRESPRYRKALPRKLRQHLQKYMSLSKWERWYIAMLYLKRKFRTANEIFPCKFSQRLQSHGGRPKLIDFIARDGTIREESIEGFDLMCFLLSGDARDIDSRFFLQRFILVRSSVGEFPLRDIGQPRLLSNHRRLTRYLREASHWLSLLANAVQDDDDSTIRHLTSKAINFPGSRYGQRLMGSNEGGRGVIPSALLSNEVRWKPRIQKMIKDWRTYMSSEKFSWNKKMSLRFLEAEQQAMNPLIIYMEGIDLVANHFDKKRTENFALISASQLYKFLLSQDPSWNIRGTVTSLGGGLGSGPERGRWWYRLAVTIATTSNSKPTSLRVCEHALQQDPWVKGMYEIILRQKYRQIQEAIERDRYDSLDDHSKKTSSPFRPLQYRQLVGHITTRKLKSHPENRGARFVDIDGTSIGVETFVVNMFLHVKEPSVVMQTDENKGCVPRKDSSIRLFPDCSIVKKALQYYSLYKTLGVYRSEADCATSPQLPSLRLCSARALGRLGWRGLHSENSLWKTVFSILCWDEIFVDRSLFHNCFQQFPMNSTFVNLQQIEDRINYLRTLNGCGLACEIHKRYHRHFGKLAHAVRWDQYPCPLLCELVHTMGDAFQGSNALSCVLKSFGKEYFNSSVGLPDLSVWKPVRCSSCPFGKVGDSEGTISDDLCVDLPADISSILYAEDEYKTDPQVKQWSWKGLISPSNDSSTDSNSNGYHIVWPLQPPASGALKFSASLCSQRRYCFYMVEVKDASSDRPSPQQYAWFERFSRAGATAVVGVCWVHNL